MDKVKGKIMGKIKTIKKEKKLVSSKVYMTPEEKKWIKEKADELNLSMSNYYREKVGLTKNEVGRKAKSSDAKINVTVDSNISSTNHIASTVNFQNPKFREENQKLNNCDISYSETSDERSVKNLLDMVENSRDELDMKYKKSCVLPDGLVDDALDELEKLSESSESKVAPHYENNLGLNSQ